MSNLFKLFKLRKEERWLAAVALVVFTFFNVLLMASHWKLCTQSASGGFYSLFTRWFNMSGYDCWSWIMVSGKQVYFVIFLQRKTEKLHIHNVGITVGNNECGITYFSYKAC